jgi:hypothetical protein
MRGRRFEIFTMSPVSGTMGGRTNRRDGAPSRTPLPRKDHGNSASKQELAEQGIWGIIPNC